MRVRLAPSCPRHPAAHAAHAAQRSDGMAGMPHAWLPCSHKSLLCLLTQEDCRCRRKQASHGSAATAPLPLPAQRPSDTMMGEPFSNPGARAGGPRLGRGTRANGACLESSESPTRTTGSDGGAPDGGASLTRLDKRDKDVGVGVGGGGAGAGAVGVPAGLYPRLWPLAFLIAILSRVGMGRWSLAC